MVCKKKIIFLGSLIFTNFTTINPILSQSNLMNPQLNNYFYKLGINTAQKMCQGFTRSDLRDKCNQIVNNATYLDFDAVSLCENKFLISTYTINCLEKISDKIYTDTDLQNCGNNNNERQINDCLKNSGRIAQSGQSNFDYQVKLALENAQQVCNSFTNINTKNNCNQIFNNTAFLDLNAVSLCRQKFSLSPKILNCFQTINNKNYTFSQISDCQKQTGETNLLQCLARNGKGINP